jgi:tetratricopeptide (TPR) repeat protein
MDVNQDIIDRQRQYEELQELGDYYASVGNYAQAQHYYEKAANLAPDEPGPYIGLGVAALQENILEDAEIAFRVACRLDAGCSRAYAGLGMVAQQKANYKQAFEMYLKCLEQDTDNLIALLGLFQTSCQMGSFAKVIHYLEVYLEIHPGDTSVMFPLAALYMKDGRFEKSKEVLSELLISDPDHQDASNLLEELEHILVKTTQEPKPSQKSQEAKSDEQ